MGQYKWIPVPEDLFWMVVGNLNCHSRIEGPYPHNSIFILPSGQTVGMKVNLDVGANYYLRDDYAKPL